MGPTAAQWTMFFSDAVGRGWSEKLWWNGAPANQQTVNATANQIVPARLNCLAMDCKLLRIRCESNLSHGPFVIAYFGGNGQAGGYQQKSVDSEIRLLYRVDDNVGHFNKNFLGGIPADQVQGDNYLAAGSFPLLLTQYWNTVSAQLFVIESTMGTPGSYERMTALTPTGGTGYYFQTATPSTLQVGSIIHVKGAQEYGYNGRHTVTQVHVNQPVSYDTVWVGGSRVVQPDPLESNPQYLELIYNNYPIVNTQAEGIVVHKTGKPFGLPRGRKGGVLPRR